MANDVTVVSVEQTEINGKRYYKVTFSDGSFRHLRSVTSVTHGAKVPSFLDEWEKQQVEALGVKGFKDAMNQKADDGTNLHKLIEQHIAGQDFEIEDTDIRTMFENYLRWEEKRKPHWLWTEKTLYSLKYGFAGRCDGRAAIGNRNAIVDFKSAKAARDDHKEQGCAYLIADSEMKPAVHADSVLILCLGSETKQGYTETWLDTPADIVHHFMGFQLKSHIVNFHNPITI